MKTDRLRLSEHFKRYEAAILRNPHDEANYKGYLAAIVSMNQRDYAHKWKRKHQGMVYSRACILHTARELHPPGSTGRVIAEFICGTPETNATYDGVIKKLFQYTEPTQDSNPAAEANSTYVDLDEEEKAEPTTRTTELNARLIAVDKAITDQGTSATDDMFSCQQQEDNPLYKEQGEIECELRSLNSNQRRVAEFEPAPTPCYTGEPDLGFESLFVS